MIGLLFGAVVLFVLIAGARAFERASVRSIKALLAWIAALGGLTLALLLILSGRGSVAFGALALFGPLIYQQWQEARGRTARRPGAGPRPPGARGSMTRAEAYEVLGLRPGASEAEIREAHHRLMRAAHPDAGGSDWLASRINQARDVLLG
ncbi:MAG TPA: DnaJ domain-containing protein [Rhodopila sp.]|uniref:DnaJ domain-containing protein n=1 Tax=Rhodopila sp. TaxID=2480087 RepID=UPI002B932E36|nr:DnaJ domain-containing protein [Rhodopila sp.]HVY15212.1 DnaJ domain-containing protein [Rhodopila sp.]